MEKFIIQIRQVIIANDVIPSDNTQIQIGNAAPHIDLKTRRHRELQIILLVILIVEHIRLPLQRGRSVKENIHIITDRNEWRRLSSSKQAR